MCGLCMEFGPNGALQVPFNQEISETCDVTCENGEPNCKFLVNDEDGPEDRKRKWKWRIRARIGRWRISIGKVKQDLGISDLLENITLHRYGFLFPNTAKV